MDWLLSSIDPARGHEVGFALSWHARFMVLAWGVIVPAAIFAARYFKILPSQNWPQELDTRTWWQAHWMGQAVAYCLSMVGFGLILWAEDVQAQSILHRGLGYTVLGAGLFQIGLGYSRGSKGGPTAPAPDGSLRGDHYDMTPWRLMFETLHRLVGYSALCLAVAAIVSGMWAANAPNWMWIVIIGYWIVLLIAAAYCQVQGWAMDTYQAIWGADPALPGNKIPMTGWATQRPGDIVSQKAQKE